MRRYHIVLVMLGVVWGSSFADRALAQSDVGGFAQQELSRFRSQALGGTHSIEGLNRRDMSRVQATVPSPGQGSRSFSLGLPTPGASAGRPFANFSPSPTVSPYLNLFREDFDGNSDLNYHTLVRPMQQQQRVNQQVQRQNMETSQRLQSIAAQSNFNPQGSTQQFPTGHATTFMYFGRYYPGLSRR